MIRSTALLVALALCQTGHAQVSVSPDDSVEPIVGGIKYAGRYDVATATWTRGPGANTRGLLDRYRYSNSASTGVYYDAIGPTGFAVGGTIVDSGVIPSDDAGFPGSFSNASEIDSVRLGYCDLDPSPGVSGWTFEFYEAYTPCAGLPDPQEFLAAITVTSMPSGGCWIVDLDLSGQAFPIVHAQDGVWDGNTSLDSFAIALTYAGSGSAAAGPILAGNPAATDPGWAPGDLPSAGSNTFFGGVGGCPGTGTGFLNEDFFHVEAIPGTAGSPSGCYFFGGYSNPTGTCTPPIPTPHAGLMVDLLGDDALACATVCIASQPECAALPSSTGVPAFGMAFGVRRTADNNVTLSCFDMPNDQFCMFATSLAGIDPGVPNGNGLLCLDPSGPGGIGRFSLVGQVKNSGSFGQVNLSTTTGEWDVSMIPTATGSYAAAVGLTSYFQAWFRDGVGAGYNFSTSFSITWE